jgi:hypothetical protein
MSDSLKQHISITSSFPVHHPCFEAAQLSFTFLKQQTNFFCIYRPSPSQKNKFTDSMFFDQFPDFFEHTDSLPGKTLFMGDFNFHFENVVNSNSRKMHNMLDIFSLTQSVIEPTHDKGHLLDLVLSRQYDNILLSTKLHHGLTSDHTAILCKLDVSVPSPKPEISLHRCLRKININSFKQDLSDTLSPTSSITDYNNCLRSVLDKHAPLCRRIARTRKPTPWFSSVAEQFCELKRERRKAERRWLKSKLTVHKLIYESIK